MPTSGESNEKMIRLLTRSENIRRMKIETAAPSKNIQTINQWKRNACKIKTATG